MFEGINIEKQINLHHFQIVCWSERVFRVIYKNTGGDGM